MGQFYYNRLRNNRIKGMSLGLVVMLTNLFAIYFYYLIAGQDNVSVFIVVLISFISMGLLYILGLIPFGQVLEKTATGHISTSYKLGTQKLKVKTFGHLANSGLTQDKEKYYCLILKTTNGHNLTLERYPTLSEANERLEELRMTIA
jgi:hypothetical protein